MKALRFLPDLPLPPYTYIPNRSPHPESDPQGHSFGVHRPTPSPIDPADWQASPTYLRGLDLFNAGYYWESHVEFESLWIAGGKVGIVAAFLKGLIKLAAAGVKHLVGNPIGVTSHATRAVELFRRVADDSPTFLGHQVEDLVALAERLVREGWNEPPPVLWPTRYNTD